VFHGEKEHQESREVKGQLEDTEKVVQRKVGKSPQLQPWIPGVGETQSCHLKMSQASLVTIDWPS
jgi:hypothetical protein